MAPGNNPTVFGTIPRVGRVTYITDPHFLCAGGVEIFADSAVAYPERGFSHLIGSVRYLEGTRALTADEARYFTTEGRLQATGNVSVSDPDQGSSIRNGDLVYLPKTPFRQQEEMTVVTGADRIRPVAILTPPTGDDASLTESPAPYTVVGDRIVLLGSASFTAIGSVEIVRDSLFAYADSAEYEQDVGSLLLEGRARIVSASYELLGSTITMATPDADRSEVEARRGARLVGNDLVLTAARIVLFLQDDALERLVATPLSPTLNAGAGSPAPVEGASADSVAVPPDPRPQATVQDFVLTADSLQVDAPDQAVERVFAAGTARSVSTSRDSLNVDVLPEVARTDWLEGDTVIVTFSAPAADSSSNAGTVTARSLGSGDSPQLEVDQIVAIGRARSLYRLPPSDSTSRPGTDPPAVHYVIGDRITIEMTGREVDQMTVVGKTHGVHLEPLATRRRTPADTLGIGVDTLRAAVDTLGTGVDSMVAPVGVGDTAAAAHVPYEPARPRKDPTTHPTFEPAAHDRSRLEIPTWKRH